MTLSTTLSIYLGALIECLWLWDAASEKFDKPDQDRIKAPGPSPTMTAISIAMTVGITLIGISELIGENPVTVTIDNVLQYLLMGAAMFFILVAGAVGVRLLPRVNEYNITIVLATVAFNTVTQGGLNHPILIGVFIGVPLILAVALGLQKTSPTPIGKVILYLLYLGALILLTFQSGIIESMQQSEFTIPEAFIFGNTFTFLSLHTLFGLRFLVIATALILPANRIYTQPMMTKLFKDDQVAPLPFFLTLAGVLGAVYLNHRLALLPADTFTGVVVVLSTQLLFRSKDTSDIV